MRLNNNFEQSKRFFWLLTNNTHVLSIPERQEVLEFVF